MAVKVVAVVAGILACVALSPVAFYIYTLVVGPGPL